VKHGALSGPQGYVTITGDLLQDGKTQIFQFVWTESGGPVVEPPKRRGFGSSILSGMAKRFAKTVDISYPSEGLIYQLSVPLASIQAPPSESFSQRSSTQVDEPSVRDLREIKMEVTLAG
jgi:two-component sensor histidine kinase